MFKTKYGNYNLKFTDKALLNFQILELIFDLIDLVLIRSDLNLKRF